MGDKIIQKNILKIVSERLNPQNRISQAKQKSCLVCKKKKQINTPTKQKSIEDSGWKKNNSKLRIFSGVFKIFIHQNPNTNQQFSIHSIDQKQILSKSKQQYYFEQIRKTAQEEAKQMIKKWCNYMLDFMKNGQRLTFYNNLPFFYQKEMKKYRQQSEQQILKFLNNKRQEKDDKNLFNYDLNFFKQIQSNKTLPTKEKLEQNIIDDTYLRMLILQAQGIQQLLYNSQNNE